MPNLTKMYYFNGNLTILVLVEACLQQLYLRFCFGYITVFTVKKQYLQLFFGFIFVKVSVTGLIKSTTNTIDKSARFPPTGT